MKYIYVILSQLIRDGKVRVDIPAVDMNSLAEICKEHNQWVLDNVWALVYADEMTDREKIEALQELLEEEEE